MRRPETTFTALADGAVVGVESPEAMARPRLRIALALVLLVVPTGSAQETGGSFGGSHFEDDTGGAGFGGSHEDSFGASRQDSFGGSHQDSFGGSHQDSFGGSHQDSFGGSHQDSFGGSHQDSFSGSHQDSFGGSNDDSYGAHERTGVDAPFRPSVPHATVRSRGVPDAGGHRASIGFGAFLCCALAAVLLFGLGLFAFVLLSDSAPRGTPGFDAVHPRPSTTQPRLRNESIRSGPMPIADVSAIRIALDHHARAEMQANLDAMARRVDTRSRAGLASALHEVCTELRRNKVSWIHASVQNSAPVSSKQVEETFRRWVSDARSRYLVETIRGDERGVVTAPGDAAHDRGEDLGLVVVTVVVAASVPIPDVRTPDDARQLDRLLVAFGALSAAQLYALEVVWSPSREDDRMTPQECARVYPDLRLIRDETIAERIFCGYCLAPFSRASARCPRCGGPVGDARPSPAGPSPAA